ncbi:MAG: PadR family transcriptional regulator [Thermoanaerobaculia bacterium]
MRDELTELEWCVVGVVWRDGPMTAYEIAALFTKSLSPYWSGSAGAIYPAVSRLRRRGLIRGDRRVRKTVLSITKKGIAALREWLTPPLPEDAVAPSLDSVRTRLFFLEVLPLKQRLAFLAEAERAVKERIAQLEERRREDEASGEIFEAFGGLAVIYELKARLRWLEAVRKYVLKS